MRIPTRVNEYGFDPFGYDPQAAARAMLPAVYLYRNWFRAEWEGLEKIPLLLRHVAKGGPGVLVLAALDHGRTQPNLLEQILHVGEALV